MQQIFTLLFISLCTVMITPTSAMAYEVLDTAAYDLGDGTSVFVIQYEFGFLNGDTYAAAEISRGGEKTPALQFSLLDSGDGTITTGITASGVVSSVLRDGDFFIAPAGENGQFSLVVVHQALGGVTPTALVIDKLGVLAETEDEVKLIEVSESELEDYQASL